MAIPESQLNTWAHQGSITQSKETYATIKKTLESEDSPYYDRSFGTFLQGSYGNDTNIYAESDVDVIIQLTSCFYSDKASLSDDEKAAFENEYQGKVAYGYKEFKKDVLAHLKEEYGSSIVEGKKAIKIKSGGNRRSADVVVCTDYRRYYNFKSSTQASYTEGICFFDADGKQIVNYPKLHSANCTEKHRATAMWFKPMVRILKNLRNKLVEEKMLKDGVAPSYFIEGLLYNVPDDKFGTNYADTLVAAINWLHGTDRSKLVCANGQYFLLNDSSPVTWRAGDCTKFLDAAIKLWNEWK